MKTRALIQPSLQGLPHLCQLTGFGWAKRMENVAPASWNGPKPQVEHQMQEFRRLSRGTVASSKLANGRPSPTKSRKPQNFDPKYDQSPFPIILKMLELAREAGGLSQYLEPAKDRF